MMTGPTLCMYLTLEVCRWGKGSVFWIFSDEFEWGPSRLGIANQKVAKSSYGFAMNMSKSGVSTLASNHVYEPRYVPYYYLRISPGRNSRD